MLMIRAGIDLQLLGHLTSQGALGQHADDGMANRELRLLSQQLAIGRGLDAAGIAAVMVLDLLVQLLAGEDHFVSVDNDHIVTGIHMGGIDGLVLPAKDIGHLAGNTAQHLALSIDDIPLALDVGGFRHESIQRGTLLVLSFGEVCVRMMVACRRGAFRVLCRGRQSHRYHRL